MDTSILIKSYVHEPRSDEAIDVLESLKDAVPLSPLLRLEFTNALQLKQFRKELAEFEVSRFLEVFHSDIQSGLIRPLRVDVEAVYARALEFSAGYSATLGSRSLDILHVATAVESGCDMFLTFDSRQGKLAREVGLQVCGD